MLVFSLLLLVTRRYRVAFKKGMAREQGEQGGLRSFRLFIEKDDGRGLVYKSRIIPTLPMVSVVLFFSLFPFFFFFFFFFLFLIFFFFFFFFFLCFNPFVLNILTLACLFKLLRLVLLVGLYKRKPSLANETKFLRKDDMPRR